MKKTIILPLFLTIACFASMAQQSDGGKRDDWKKELQEFKYQYLTQEVQLTEDQQKPFFELYSQMEAEKAKAGRECRALKKKAKADGATDEDYEAAVNAMIDLKLLEAQIEKRYYEQFKTILSKKQLYLLKVAEREFNKKLMKMQKGKKDGGKKHKKS